MKKILAILLVLLMSNLVSGQNEDSVRRISMEDYLRKSRGQKTAAWVLLGGGAALVPLGLATIEGNTGLSGNDLSSGVTSGAAIIVIGGVSMASSILLFNAAAKNKSKANSAPMAIFFKMEKAGHLGHPEYINSPYPALAWRLTINQNK